MILATRHSTKLPIQKAPTSTKASNLLKLANSAEQSSVKIVGKRHESENNGLIRVSSSLN